MSLEGATLGIYRLGEELGRGGMGTVFRAESTEEGPAGPPGSVVAIKVFHPELVTDELAFSRFQLEAEIGKEIRHEHLVRTYGIGSGTADDQTYHFMVMEVVEGRTLTSLLAELGTFPEHLLYSVSDQVLAALAEIHTRGVVHRDIKPDNIIITPDHRVLLMDLGVARREEASELASTSHFVGSLPYAPPEQFRAIDAGPRADIYAFGVSLYELATGHNPYEGESVPTILQRKMDGEIPPPRDESPDLDEFWNQVIHTCVRREPSSRFAAATELRAILADGERSSWWQARKAGRVIPNAERALKRLRLDRDTQIVARETELAGLEAFRSGTEGGTMLVCGPVGVGKSRLLFEYLESIAKTDGPLIAAGRCVGDDGASYRPFVEIVTDLLQTDTDQPEELEARTVEVLSPTPDVARNLAGFLAGRVQLGETFSKDALHSAVANVIRIFAAERPCVVVIEDLHLAGPATLELFEYLHRALEGIDAVLIATVAPDEIENDALAALEADPRVHRMILPLLDADATEELVARATASERTARTIGRPLYDKSGGNPLIILEMVEHLLASDQLVERNRALELVGSIDEIPIPSSVSDLVGLKLERLDEDERKTLELCAVLGFEFEAQILADVLEEKLVELLERLAALERRHKLIASSGRDSFRFASRQVFDAAYTSIAEDRRAQYHDTVAETIAGALGGEQPAGRTAYELLRHVFAAGRVPDAAPYLEAALDHIDTNFHASYAAPFVEKIDAAMADAPPGKRFALAMKLWGFYERLASREDQLRMVDKAAVLAEEMGDAAARARVHAYRAGSCALAGDFDGAGEAAQAGLSLAREAGDRKWESTCLHTSGLASFRRGDLEGAWSQWSEALEIRREISDRRGEANTLLTLAAVMPAMGKADQVFRTMQESLVILREIGDRRGEARVFMNIGAHHVNSTRYHEGIGYFELAIAGHRETGARLSEGLTLTNLGHAQHMLGNIDGARASWKRALGIVVDLEDKNGELVTRTMLGGAMTAYGEYDEARAELEQAIALADAIGNKAQLINARRELGHVLHWVGDREEAWNVLEQALAMETELKDPTSRVLTVGVLARAALAEEDYERATGLLTEVLAIARDGRGASLVLCRLARAHLGAGREDEARAAAEEALQGIEAVSIFDGPEIYYTAYLVLGRGDLLDEARKRVEDRARPIRNDTFREHFLTRTWPNREITRDPPDGGPRGGSS